jgi:small subunit ribosomal protein S15
MTKSNAQKMVKPAWLKITEPELEKIIAELAGKNSPSKVGIILRDQYGVPTTKLYGKKLSHYLKNAGVETKEDLENAGKKVEKIKEHMKINITDKKAKHKLQKAQSRLNVLKKYYSKN